MRQQIALAQTALITATAQGDAITQMRLQGKLGEWHYLLGESATALPLLRGAVTLAERLGDARALAAQRLRLATALHYANCHADAIALFTHGLAELAPVAESYRDFFLQHYGKCLVELGAYPQAQACFTAALALRQAKKDTTLIASTEHALAGLTLRMNA